MNGRPTSSAASLAGLHHSSDRLDDYEFAGQARELLNAYPFVSAIAEADILEPGERPAFEAHMRDSGYLEFKLRSLDGESLAHYALWRSQADFQAAGAKAREHPALPGLMRYNPRGRQFEVSRSFVNH